MDFDLSQEILEKKATARRWVEDVLDPLSVPLETEERLPDELVAELRRGEFFGLTIPTEYGGHGWSTVEWFNVLEELSRGYAMVRMIGHTMNGLFWRPLEVFGTQDQKHKYLPKLASGEIWAANSLTEPEGGTGKDINATAVKEGDHYVLNGHKWLITLFPGYTKLFYAFAVAEDEGPICFLVDAPCEGLDLVPMERMMGCSGPRHYHVYYNDLRVPASNILGIKGKGLDVAFDMLHLSRTSIAIGCVGLAQKMLDMAVGYAKERTTFGKKLAKRQAIQNNLAQMATEIDAARLMAYRAAWRFDQGLDIVKEAAMAKLFAEQVVTRTAEMALRIHGGIGYTKAYDLERHFRDARSFHFEEGTEEIQKLIIARHVLQA